MDSIDNSSHRNTDSIACETIDEKQTSNTIKIMNKNAENDERGDKPTQKNDIYLLNSCHQKPPEEAQSIDLQARHQEPSNSAASDSECDSD